MKTELFGEVPASHVHPDAEERPMHRSPSTEDRSRAINAYRASRENGEAQDNPSRPFPGDGECELLRADPTSQIRWFVRYTGSEVDELWMQEKDANFLRRTSGALSTGDAAPVASSASSEDFRIGPRGPGRR